MGNNWLFFIEPDGSSSGIFPMDPLLPHSLGGHWLCHITSFVDNSRYIYVPGSLALQEAFNCMSKFAGALVIWFAGGSSSNMKQKLPGHHIRSHSSCSKSSTQVKHISSVRHDLTAFFRNSRIRRKSAIPVVFGKISSSALKQICKQAERLQSFPVLSLAAALVPPFTNVPSNILAAPLEASSVEAQICMDQRPCEIENRGCGPCTDLYLQSLAWSKTVEPRTGVEFPTMLDKTISGQSNSSFTPETSLINAVEPGVIENFDIVLVLVGTGSRTMTIVRIKSLKVYAFGFYVHPFDVCEKLGPKYACIPEYELNKRQDFYQDLLREDINMTVRLVVSCNGIKINTVKDAFEKSLRARLLRGTTINFRRTADGQLITEGAFFDMYIGEIPVCEQTKEEIGKNVASIIRMC
ncbi:UNVERIFIED_CONTAM: Fatty-acid-binding protein 2 [Sesamum indicum]